MANIDDFKANLTGGGARANQFRVTVNTPPGINTGLQQRRTSFLCKGSNLPAQTLAEITVHSEAETFTLLETEHLMNHGLQLSSMILTL